MQPWQLCIGFLCSLLTLLALPSKCSETGHASGAKSMPRLTSAQSQILFTKHHWSKPGAQEQPFVSAWLERPVVEFGSSVMLNCSTNCQNVTSAGLETSLEKEPAGEGAIWRAFRLVNVSSWDPVPLCFFDCIDAQDMKPHWLNFTVYRLPELVQLDPVPVTKVGESYTLTCRVSSVAPIRNLSVTFLKGGKKLHTQTFEKHTVREAGDVVVSHTVTAQQTDHGEEISCRAALDFRPEGPFFEKVSFNKTLTITNYMGIIVATASVAMLAVILVGVGISSSWTRKDQIKPQ